MNIKYKDIGYGLQKRLSCTNKWRGFFSQFQNACVVSRAPASTSPVGSERLSHSPETTQQQTRTPTQVAETTAPSCAHLTCPLRAAGRSGLPWPEPPGLPPLVRAGMCPFPNHALCPPALGRHVRLQAPCRWAPRPPAHLRALPIWSLCPSVLILTVFLRQPQDWALLLRSSLHQAQWGSALWLHDKYGGLSSGSESHPSFCSLQRWPYSDERSWQMEVSSWPLHQITRDACGP